MLFQKKNKPAKIYNSKKVLSVGILRGNSHEKASLEKLGFNVVEVSNHKSLIKMLNNGRLPLISTVDLTGYRAIKTHLPESEWNNFEIVGKPFYVGNAGLCFSASKDNKLKKPFIEGLRKIKNSGKYKNLVLNYLKKFLISDHEKYFNKYWDI